MLAHLGLRKLSIRPQGPAFAGAASRPWPLCGTRRRGAFAARSPLWHSSLGTATSVPAALSAVAEQAAPSFPRGCGLVRNTQGRLSLSMVMYRKRLTVGSAAYGDFPDTPEDGWATALAYREHMERVVAMLREDPWAQVELAAVGKYGRRLRPWAPGDESVRPVVLAAIRAALKAVEQPGQNRTKVGLPAGLGFTRARALVLHASIGGARVLMGYAGSGDFPDRPEDGWATARAYREHVLRVLAKLREDTGAEVEVAEVDKRGRRLRPWAPGDESVRPTVLAGIRKALATKTAGARGRPRVRTDLPPGSGLYRTPHLAYCKYLLGTTVRLGSAPAGDFPDTPEDGWATARAYQEHVLRVVGRLKEDLGAQVEVAEVDRWWRRLRPWVPGDESLRPVVLAATIRAVLGK